MKKLYTFRIIVAVLLIFWSVFIFSLSNQNANQSSGTSGRVIRFVVQIFDPDFSEKPETEQIEIISSYQFLARKTAHFSIYGILGILAFLNTVTIKKFSTLFKFFIPLIFCFLYSVSDELHQLFIPGRSGEIRDILIDTLGSALGIGFSFIVYCFFIRRKRN